MSSIKSIAVLIPPKDKLNALKELIENSIEFAKWLNCELHLLCSSDMEESVNRLLNEALKEANWKLSAFIIHQSLPDKIEDIIDSVLAAIKKYSCDLILTQETGNLRSKIFILELLQVCLIPLMIIPKKCNFKSRLPGAFLIPLSGEQRRSESLSLALKLALQTNSFVDIVHVIDKKKSCFWGHPLETITDAMHHEYNAIKDKVAAEACPYSSQEARARIRHFYHFHGITVIKILQLIHNLPTSIIVVEWKGILAEHRALTVKALIEKAHYPIVLTRSKPEGKQKLI
jgi:hypothetical protein